jgi:hypothetical protein
MWQTVANKIETLIKGEQVKKTKKNNKQGQTSTT